MDLEFKVNNQSLVGLGHRRVANLSQEYLYLHFTFNTTDWDDLTKFALFGCDGKNYRVALADDKALVPNACLQGDRFTVMVYGVSGETIRVTTNMESVYLYDSGFTEDVDDDLPDDDPSLVEQIYEAIDEHNHDTRYYTQDEVDALINNLLNRIDINGDKKIMQTGDTVTLTAYLKENGIPLKDKTIYFYAKED